VAFPLDAQPLERCGIGAFVGVGRRLLRLGRRAMDTNHARSGGRLRRAIRTGLVLRDGRDAGMVREPGAVGAVRGMIFVSELLRSGKTIR
jgi:hypothetical protein